MSSNANVETNTPNVEIEPVPVTAPADDNRLERIASGQAVESVVHDVVSTSARPGVSPRERRVIRRLEARGEAGLAHALLRLRGVIAGARYRLVRLYAVGGEGAVFDCDDISDPGGPALVAKVPLHRYHRPARLDSDGVRRMQRIDAGAVRVLDDSYNANPASTRVALGVLASMPRAARRVVVFGDMLELGAGGPELHHAVGQATAEAGVDCLLTIGELTRATAAGALECGSGMTVEHAERGHRLVVRVAHSLDGLAVRGADLGPGPILVALAHQPRLRPVDDTAVYGVDLGHVREFLKSVCAEPDQWLAFAPPIKSAARPLKGE